MMIKVIDVSDWRCAGGYFTVIICVCWLFLLGGFQGVGVSEEETFSAECILFKTKNKNKLFRENH